MLDTTELIPEEAVERLKNDGFLLLPVSEVFSRLLAETFEAAQRFFHAPPAEKLLNKLPEDCGYRPPGIEYSQSAERPDPIESFTIIMRGADSRPLSASAQVLRDKMCAASGLFEQIAETLAMEIAGIISGQRHTERLRGALHRWSCLQMNYSRPANTDSPFLNELHEDGHLLTIACATGPGLEVQTSGHVFMPIATGWKHVIVMPGEIVWLLSGGNIRPLYHRVRRDPESDERLALLFFGDINPRLCQPWLQNETNANVDIGLRVLTNAARFGLRGLTLE